MSRLCRFGLVSEDALDQSPSRKDGMSPEIEANRRKVAARHIYETGHAFKMSVGTPAIAVTLFLRYFIRKSMKRNDPFIIAAGCLFLAGKANDEAWPAQNLAVELFKRWYGRDNPQMRQRLGDSAFVQKLFTSALEAERAILYTVGFDFNVDLPHTHIAELLRLPRFLYLKENTEFQQLAVNICNDIMRRGGTLVLQYNCRDMAIAVYYFILKAAKRENASKIPQPEPEPDGIPWFVKEGLELQLCQEIMNRISSLYKAGGQAAASSQPAASAATTMLAGGSAGGSAGDVAADSSVQPHSPVAQALAGKRRALDARSGSPDSKTARLSPIAVHMPSSATASKAHGHTETGPPAPQLTVVTVQPADASEPEEGELEEGELPD